MTDQQLAPIALYRSGRSRATQRALLAAAVLRDAGVGTIRPHLWREVEAWAERWSDTGGVTPVTMAGDYLERLKWEVLG